jgi:pyruvate dehydrogenase E1 component
MAFVRILNTLVRDKKIGKRVVPIVPDESRTFGMEGMFRQLGIYSQVGQLYTPQDADQLMFYKEDKNGPDPAGRHQRGRRDVVVDRRGDELQHHGVPMIPFYIFYSMFGFQRVGDLCLGGRRHARARLPARRHRRAHHAERRRPAARGRPQPHAAATIPNCVSYDPTFAYELAVIIQDGLRRMYQEQEDVFYYITVMNENYAHPGHAGRARGGHPQGHVPAARGQGEEGRSRAVQLLGSGTILREVIAARRAAGEGLRRRRRHLERHQLQRAAPRRLDARAGTCCTRKREPRVPTSSSA